MCYTNVLAVGATCNVWPGKYGILHVELFFFFFFGSVVDDIHGETKDTCDDSEGYMEMVLEQCV